MNDPSNPLRILSFGAGAIGVYIGGSLALAGHPVAFIERPDVATELKKNGIHLEIAATSHTLKNIQVAASLEEALSTGRFDVMIFAVKAYDTAAALEILAPFKDQLPPLVCLQNGIENEILLAQALGSEKIIPGTVTSAIGRRASGDIVLEKSRGVGVAAGDPLAPQLVQAMRASGLNARLFENGASMKWSKMLTNLPANPASAILDMPPGEIFSHPGLYRIEIQALREALQVMDAMRIPVTDLPGTPVRSLALAIRLPVGLSRLFLPRAIGGGRGAKMPSFHIDLYNRRGKSEVGYLNGAVVRFGEKIGIAAPANRFLNDTLTALTLGDLPLDAYARKPEKLIQDFRKNL